MNGWVLFVALLVIVLSTVKEGSSSWRRIPDVNCEDGEKPNCEDIVVCNELVVGKVTVIGWSCISPKTIKHVVNDQSSGGPSEEGDSDKEAGERENPDEDEGAEGGGPTEDAGEESDAPEGESETQEGEGEAPEEDSAIPEDDTDAPEGGGDAPEGDTDAPEEGGKEAPEGNDIPGEDTPGGAQAMDPKTHTTTPVTPK